MGLLDVLILGAVVFRDLWCLRLSGFWKFKKNTAAGSPGLNDTSHNHIIYKIVYNTEVLGSNLSDVEGDHF